MSIFLFRRRSDGGSFNSIPVVLVPRSLVSQADCDSNGTRALATTIKKKISLSRGTTLDGGTWAHRYRHGRIMFGIMFGATTKGSS
jgi:hypothetical protein